MKLDWKNVVLVVALVAVVAIVAITLFSDGAGTDRTVTTNLTINFYDAPDVAVHKGNITTWTLVNGEWTYTSEAQQGGNTTWIFQGITGRSNCYDQVKAAVEIAGTSLAAEDQPFGTFVKSIDGVDNEEHDSRGWQYYVNDVYSNKACNKYAINDDDIVRWEYIKNPFAS
jgi:hypothetical protein